MEPTIESAAAGEPAGGPMAAEKPVDSLNGTGLPLSILGGLIVGMVVASASPFVEFLVQPFSVNAVGERTQPPQTALLLGLVVYLSFLLNVFRQIHGLGIVFDDPEYQQEVGHKLTEWGRARALLSAVIVLASVGFLVGIVRARPSDPLRVLFAMPDGTELTPAAWILAFHLLTVLSYMAWDVIAAKTQQPERSPEVRGFLRLYWRAASYATFLSNWKHLAIYSIGVAGVSIVLTWALAGPWASLFPMITLVILTVGYSATDYVCNRHFYFRQYALTATRQRREEVPLRTRAIVILSLVVIAIVGTVGWLAVRTSFLPTAKPRVALQLKWFYNAGFVGDLVAKDQGWEGLDVDVRAGGVGIDPIKAVLSGDAQFGVATGDQLLLAAEEGAPVVALGLVYQRNPLAWIVKKQSNIASPANFAGHSIGLTYIDDEALFMAMISRAGLSHEELTIVPVKSDTTPFKTDEIVAYPVFRNTQGVEIANELGKAGIATHFVGPSDVGVQAYSNTYFTSRQYLDKHPKIVEAFMSGVLGGWRLAQENPSMAAKIVAKYDKETPLGVIEESVRETNKLVLVPGTDQIGVMSMNGWEETDAVFRNASVLKQTVQVVQRVNGEIPGRLAERSLVFTNEFVE